MRAMGIDLGTTTISIILADGDSGRLLDKRCIAHHAFLKDPAEKHSLQDADRIWKLTAGAAGEIMQKYGKPDSIGMTGQMHGILYTDAGGNAVSPLYTWQDAGGDEKTEEGGTYASVLDQKAGAASAGFGLTTHYYLQCRHLIPENAVRMTTVSDYVAMKLCGGVQPVIGQDMAASFGCFDLKRGDFRRAALEQAGVDLRYLPVLLPSHGLAGTTVRNDEAGIPAGIPTAVSIGDNQASVFGSVRNPADTVLVNVGTGSQVSFGTSGYLDLRGSIDLRPFSDNLYLMAGSGLCGGRAYAMLEQFYREAAGVRDENEQYDLMEKQARAFLASKGAEQAWQIRTTFSGTRSNPEERGKIEGIGTENFCPGAMTVGMLQGILKELYDMYREMCSLTGRKALHLAGSGNAVRKNALLRELAEKLFGMPMEIPACCEEAAYGAALLSLVSAGCIPSEADLSSRIRYLTPSGGMPQPGCRPRS